MTTDKLDAPARIWLDPSYVDSPRKALACNLATADKSRALASDVEYIRADAIATLPEVAALVEAVKPFAEIGIGTDPDYQPMIRMNRDAILAARDALAALRATGQGGA